MGSRQETARPLLTPGEVMQLPPADELVLVSGLPPIRAKKLRYYADYNFRSRVAAAPMLAEKGYCEIGRASCRERVCQYVSISVVAVSLLQKRRSNHTVGRTPTINL